MEDGKRRASLQPESIVAAGLCWTGRLDGENVGILDDQELFVNKSTMSVTASAKVTGPGVVAIIPLDVHVRYSGIPVKPPINDPRIITVHLEQDSSEDVVSVQSATYIDDDFGSWQPADGFPINAILPVIATGTREDDFDYLCASEANVNYSTRVETILDVIAAIPDAPTGLLHTSLIQTDMDCHP